MERKVDSMDFDFDIDFDVQLLDEMSAADLDDLKALIQCDNNQSEVAEDSGGVGVDGNSCRKVKYGKGFIKKNTPEYQAMRERNNRAIRECREKQAKKEERI